MHGEMSSTSKERAVYCFSQRNGTGFISRYAAQPSETWRNTNGRAVKKMTLGFFFSNVVSDTYLISHLYVPTSLQHLVVSLFLEGKFITAPNVFISLTLGCRLHYDNISGFDLLGFFHGI